MDPIGFALENFDAVGSWRTQEAGGPIDASGQLADGTQDRRRRCLRNAILARPDVFVTTMTEKMFVYALGRGVEAHDRPAIRPHRSRRGEGRTIVFIAGPRHRPQRGVSDAHETGGRGAGVERRRTVDVGVASGFSRTLGGSCVRLQEIDPAAALSPWHGRDRGAAAAGRDVAGDDRARAVAGAAAHPVRRGLLSQRRHHGGMDPG